MGGRDAQAGELLHGSIRGVVGDGSRESASTVAELADPWQFGAGLRQEVDAGDPEVRDAITDELDDIVRAHEQDVELEVLDPRDQASIVLLEDEAGVVKQAGGWVRPCGLCSGRRGAGGRCGDRS